MTLRMTADECATVRRRTLCEPPLAGPAAVPATPGAPSNPAWP